MRKGKRRAWYNVFRNPKSRTTARLARNVSIPVRAPGGSRWRRNRRTAGYLGIEYKFLDPNLSDYNIPASTDASSGEMMPERGCTGCLTAPAQGNSESEREGRKIVVKSVFVSGCINFTPVAGQTSPPITPYIFVALVMDTQTNAATLSSENVFTNPNDTALTNHFPLRNLEYSKRFKVLQHKSILCPLTIGQDAAGTFSVSAEQRKFTLFWKGDMPVTFNSGVTANVSCVTDNSIHLIAYSTSATLTPSMYFNARTRFVG